MASREKTKPPPSNLKSFLHSTTPVVPSRLLPKACYGELNRLWHPWEETEEVEYFMLRDVWECYEEWSWYGAGAPVVLDDKGTVVQYYVPYLSAIQIYVSGRSFSEIRSSNVEAGKGDGEGKEMSTDSYSDESESDRPSRSDSSAPADSRSDQDALWHFSERLGYLYFQYFERSAPHARLPLVLKIRGFAKQFPGLMTLKSVDLSPASWMAVAWYPIYHIPTRGTAKDLSACFLTYHTISSSFQEDEFEGEREKSERKGIALFPFGLATYKMQFDLWARDNAQLQSLISAAESWLKQLQANHHDFSFFTRALLS